MRQIRLFFLAFTLLVLGSCNRQRGAGEASSEAEPAGAAGGGVAVPGVAQQNAPPVNIDPSQMELTESGVQYRDAVVGSGPEAAPGHRVQVHYTGWLTDGTRFDSSKDRGVPFEFVLGAGEVIRGWDDGVAGMRVGGTRVLVIPPALGYPNGAGNVIPPGATLVFEVELLRAGN